LKKKKIEKELNKKIEKELNEKIELEDKLKQNEKNLIDVKQNEEKLKKELEDNLKENQKIEKEKKDDENEKKVKEEIEKNKKIEEIKKIEKELEEKLKKEKEEFGKEKENLQIQINDLKDDKIFQTKTYLKRNEFDKNRFNSLFNEIDDLRKQLRKEKRQDVRQINLKELNQKKLELQSISFENDENKKKLKNEKKEKKIIIKEKISIEEKLSKEKEINKQLMEKLKNENSSNFFKLMADKIKDGEKIIIIDTNIYHNLFKNQILLQTFIENFKNCWHFIPGMVCGELEHQNKKIYYENLYNNFENKNFNEIINIKEILKILEFLKGNEKNNFVDKVIQNFIYNCSTYFKKNFICVFSEDCYFNETLNTSLYNNLFNFDFKKTMEYLGKSNSSSINCLFENYSSFKKNKKINKF
jgi:hypothetical protein